MEQSFKRENPRINPFFLKVRTLNCLGKWANDGLKKRSFMLQPAYLCRDKGVFIAMYLKLSSVFIFYFIATNTSFILTNNFVAMCLPSSLHTGSFFFSRLCLCRDEPAATIQQLHLNLISSIIFLSFPSKPGKHKQMGD